MKIKIEQRIPTIIIICLGIMLIGLGIYWSIDSGEFFPLFFTASIYFFLVGGVFLSIQHREDREKESKRHK